MEMLSFVLLKICLPLKGKKKITFLAVETLPLKQRHKLFISLRNFLSKRRCQVFAGQEYSP